MDKEYIDYLHTIVSKLIIKENITQIDIDQLNKEIKLVKSNVSSLAIPEMEVINEINVKDSLLQRGLEIVTWIQFFLTKLVLRFFFGNQNQSKRFREKLEELRNTLSHIIFKYWKQ